MANPNSARKQIILWIESIPNSSIRFSTAVATTSPFDWTTCFFIAFTATLCSQPAIDVSITLPKLPRPRTFSNRSWSTRIAFVWFKQVSKKKFFRMNTKNQLITEKSLNHDLWGQVTLHLSRLSFHGFRCRARWHTNIIRWSNINIFFLLFSRSWNRHINLILS